MLRAAVEEAENGGMGEADQDPRDTAALRDRRDEIHQGER